MKNLDSAIEQLERGKILIYPTETLYGMGVDALNETAVRHLFDIKKRDLSKTVPVLLPSRKSISKYCEKIPQSAQKLMDAFWPGPLTIILQSKAFPQGVTQNNTVGFRVSSHPFVQALLSRYAKPITGTSANLSDKEQPLDTMDFFKVFPKDSFILIQQEEPFKSSKPSTVIDCTHPEPKIVREGAISKQKINEVLQGNV